MTANTGNCATPLQADTVQSFDQRDRDRTQAALDQLGKFLHTTFRVVCTPRNDDGRLQFNVQDVDSMQTASINPREGILMIGNVHQPHLRPAELMLDPDGLTVYAYRELAGIFMQPITPDNTPAHLHEELFDTEVLHMHVG